jgi:hypothetical protein
MLPEFQGLLGGRPTRREEHDDDDPRQD